MARQFLVANHNWICQQNWADDYAAELHQAWTTAKMLSGRWESAELLRQRYCPWCKAGALYQEPGSVLIECQSRAGGCGRRMESEEYLRMAKMRAAFLDGHHCPWCDADALYAAEDDESVECMAGAGGCGQRMTRKTYDQMCGARHVPGRANGAA